MTMPNRAGEPRRIARWLAVACIAALWPTAAGADTIIALHPLVPPPLGADTAVLRVDTATSQVTQIGLAGVPSLSGLAVQPGSGVLFASSGFGGTHPGSLFTLNPATGAATLIGPTGFGAVPAITFDRDGTLFGSGGVAPTQPFPTAGNTLIRINPSTGAGSFVGLFGTGIDGMAGLAVNPRTGILYGVGAEFNGNGNFTNLFTINKQTGAATLLGPLQGLPPAAMPTGLTFNSGGTLFASLAGGQGLGLGAGAGEIGIVDLNTLRFNAVAQAPQGSVSDLAVIVPEPSSLALLALGGIALAGWRRRQGRRARTATSA